MVRRGFSLVEMLFVVMLTSLVLGTTVGVFSFTLSRMAQGGARFVATDQARKALDEIEAVVRDSTGCTVMAFAQNPALRCTLSANSQRNSSLVDSTAASSNKLASPSGVTRRGYERHARGKRVWFYFANSAGAVGTAGTYLWRAERNDDANPTAADLVSKFPYHPGTSVRRFDLLTSISFLTNSTTRTATITVGSRALWRDERSGAATDKASQSVTDVRVVGWRHWFQ